MGSLPIRGTLLKQAKNIVHWMVRILLVEMPEGFRNLFGTWEAAGFAMMIISALSAAVTVAATEAIP